MISTGSTVNMRHFCIKRMINALKFIDTFDAFIKTSTAKGLALNKCSHLFFLGVSSEMGDLTSNQLMSDLSESSASKLSSSGNESETYYRIVLFASQLSEKRLSAAWTGVKDEVLNMWSSTVATWHLS